MNPMTDNRITMGFFTLAIAGAFVLAASACEKKTDTEKMAELMESVHEAKTERAEQTSEELADLREASALDRRGAEIFALKKRFEAVKDRADDAPLVATDKEAFAALADRVEPALDSLDVTDDDYNKRRSIAERNIQRLEALVDQAT